MISNDEAALLLLRLLTTDQKRKSYDNFAGVSVVVQRHYGRVFEKFHNRECIQNTVQYMETKEQSEQGACGKWVLRKT